MIAQKANLLEEAYTLLYSWIKQNDFNKLRDEYKKLYTSDADSYNKSFDLIIEMYNYVINNIKADRDRIEYYFKERSPQCTFAAMALLLDFSNINDEIPAYRVRQKSLSLADRISLFAMNVSDEEEANTPKEELSDEAGLVAFLEASALDTESKWEAIKIFNNQEKYYNEAAAILREAMELLSSKYGKVIKKLSDNFFNYWSSCQEDTDIIESINNKIKISWKLSEAGSLLSPMIFSPFSMTIATDLADNVKEDIIRIGILIDKRFEVFISKGLNKEDIVEIGKILSDKSKVDILELISKKPYYGKELADALGLTTATISYHVNALLRTSCLQAQIKANKVYYSIDNEKLGVYLDGVKSFFAGKNTE